MRELIRFEDRHYILATSSRVDDRTRVLKDGETFAVFDRLGNLSPHGRGEQGLYHEGTRYLSQLELLAGGTRPLLLGSEVREDNLLLAVDLANADIAVPGTANLAANRIHLLRSVFLWRGACYQTIRIRSFTETRLRLPIRVLFAADFADVFEVRGTVRPRRGRRRKVERRRGAVTLAYEGLDGIVRSTEIRFQPLPGRIGPADATFTVPCRRGEEARIEVVVRCHAEGARRGRILSPGTAIVRLRASRRRIHALSARIDSSNEHCNRWLERSSSDLAMMLTHVGREVYPYAGIPWYSTIFGRDGIMTALECLWLAPAIARGVLAVLAREQAAEQDPERDAEPGKIVHEIRKGEMAALGEIPFGRYYGSVDATPLFVVLAGAYERRTGDRAFLRRLWPHVSRAMDWIERYGDADGDGFVEYHRRSRTGLHNQGWKDSHDAVFHRDGSLAEGSIALVEVQAYVYAALLAAFRLAGILGVDGAARERWRKRAARLRVRFDEAFWCPALGTYGLALDGKKRLCRVRTSNAGHALLAGIARPGRAARVARTLLGPAFDSGWGIRTVAAGEARYNPISYHDGSVWPHDNALIAYGFARYGHRDAAVRILEGLFDASRSVELHRLPELFCGFERREGEGPTDYPVACSPQAWSTASVFLCLQAVLGIRVDAGTRRVRFHRPILPEFLEEVRIRDLRVGGASVDLTCTRAGRDVTLHVTRRQGDVRVTIEK